MAVALRKGEGKSPTEGYVVRVLYTGTKEESEKALKEARRYAFQRVYEILKNEKGKARC